MGIIGIQALILIKIILRPFDNKIYEEAIHNKKYDEAIDFCHRSIDLNSKKSPESWKQLANVYLLKGEYDKAIDTFKSMMNIKMRNNDAFEQIINIYLLEEDYLSALEICNLRLSNNPYDSGFPKIIPKLYEKFAKYDGFFGQFTDLITQYLSKFPNNHSMFYFLAEIYKNHKDFENSLVQINKALEVMPISLKYQKFKQDLLLQKEEKK